MSSANRYKSDSTQEKCLMESRKKISQFSPGSLFGSALAKMSHFQFWHFSSIFVQMKLTCLVTLFDRKQKYGVYLLWHFSSIFVQIKLTSLVTLFGRKLKVFKNSPNCTIFYKLLSTQNVNVAHFARDVE